MTAAAPAAAERVLVVNAGSSSLKLRVLDPGDAVTARADLPAPRGAADDSAIKAAIESFGPVDAVGHRIVHGGTLYAAAVRIDDQVRQRLESLTDLAPLHQPKSLAALDAVQAVLPTVPAVACFDPPSTPPSRPPRPRSRCRRSGEPAGTCDATDSTGCRTRMRRGGRRRSSIVTPPACGLSPATWARERRWPQSATAGRWTRRWGSPRWTAW